METIAQDARTLLSPFQKAIEFKNIASIVDEITKISKHFKDKSTASILQSIGFAALASHDKICR